MNNQLNQKRWAQDLVAWAVRQRILVKSTDCEQCGYVPHPDDHHGLVGHHWLGYEYPVALVVEWLCTSCHNTAHPRIRPPLTSEQRRRSSEAAKRRMARRTPEELSEIGRHMSAAVTTEGRRKASQAHWDRYTPEERSEMLRQRVNSLTPEQRERKSQKQSAARKGKPSPLTPEQQSALGRAGSRAFWDNLTDEERAEVGEAARQRALEQHRRRTPEERSAIARKAWETRRARSISQT